jgi:5-methylcytosine-specific restriction enzyme A
MPSKPLKPCNAIRCPNLTKDKYCDDHKQVEQQLANHTRGTAAERGYNYKWQKARLGYLKKHPLCIHCQLEGIFIPARVVDHIVPHKGDTKLFWDKSNWQPLCKRHHDIKTATEDGGFGRKMSKEVEK